MQQLQVQLKQKYLGNVLKHPCKCANLKIHFLRYLTKIRTSYFVSIGAMTEGVGLEWGCDSSCEEYTHAPKHVHVKHCASWGNTSCTCVDCVSNVEVVNSHKNKDSHKVIAESMLALIIFCILDSIGLHEVLPFSPVFSTLLWLLTLAVC